MTFRTEIFPDNQGLTICYRDHIMLMGSCFVENIGHKLLSGRFATCLNPFGIVFNPASIASGVRMLVENKRFSEDDLCFHDGQWHSFSHHSRYSASDKNECLSRINAELVSASSFLRKSTILIITFGTAWIFERADNGKVVSNCHKMPAENFRRRLLSAEEISALFSEALSAVIQINPQIKILFTLSPVRHFKDGAENNSLSKAVLRLAIDNLCSQHKAKYFPAYELVMDDLRDYRFYDSDLCHPSLQAIEYIWEKFSECYFENETKNILKKIEDLNAALHHKPFNPGSDMYRKFINKNIALIDEWSKQYPFLNLTNLKSAFSELI